MASVTPVNTQRSVTFGGRYQLPINSKDTQIFERHIVPLFKAMKDEPIQAYQVSSKLYVYTGSSDVEKLKTIIPASTAKANYTQAAYGIKPTRVVEQGEGMQASQFLQNVSRYPLKELANIKELIKNIIIG